MHIRTPVCGACLNGIEYKIIPSALTSNEYELVNLIKAIKDKAGITSTRTGTDTFYELIEDIECLAPFVDVAELDFKHKAAAASRSAEKLEWLRKHLSEARQFCESKYRATYDVCRGIASRKISAPQIRKIVFERDNFKCKICGTTDGLSVDHIIPVVRGGSSELGNLQTLCITCNSSKGKKL